MTIQPVDKKFYKDIPDVDFSPERNNSIIDETIEKYEKMRKERLDEHYRKVGERSQAVVKWLEYVDKGGSKNIEQFLGKKNLEYLRGHSGDVLKGKLVIPN